MNVSLGIIQYIPPNFLHQLRMAANTNNKQCSQPHKLQDYKKFSTNVGGFDKDKHQSHFALQPPQVITNAVRNLLHAQGNGAEQDSYGNHFSRRRSSIENVKTQANSQVEEQVTDNHHAGIVEDGMTKMKQILGAKGEGAEQDSYNQHFGLGQEGVENVKKALDATGVGSHEASVASLLSSLSDVKRWDC
jgi:hypothetical protein